MPEQNNQPPAPKPSGSKRVWIIPLIILVVLAIIFGLYFGLASVLRRVNQNVDQTQPTGTLQTDKFTDKNLVGTWVSECLVPDQNSPWSEKHQFVIKSDGTAVHTRWSSSDHICTPEETLVNNYKLAVPAGNLINLTDSDNGSVAYDIYQIAGSTLMFGHGFRGDDPAMQIKDNNNGGTEATRITSLNKFIVYKKQ